MAKDKKAKEPKRRTVKVIFNPLSVLFYAGLGYVVYRQVRKRRQLPAEAVPA